MYLRFTQKFFVYILIYILFFGALALNRAQAQTINDLMVEVIPSNPSPGENVSISINSYTLNLNSLNITWLINNKNVLSGIGKTKYSLTAPDEGGGVTVSIKVKSDEGEILKNLDIRPTAMTILWEAKDSYVPAFYKGKALPAPDSQVRIVAIPEIKVGGLFLNPKNMDYSWRKDFSNDQEASGYSKNYFDYISDYLDPSNYIEVSASTIDQKYTSSDELVVETFKPKLVFYKNDPKLGTLFEKTIENGHLIADQEILVASPYFISPKNILNPRLTWTWGINGKQIETSSIFKYLLPLKVQDGVSGKSNIQLEIENMDKVFQTAKKTISVEF